MDWIVQTSFTFAKNLNRKMNNKDGVSRKDAIDFMQGEVRAAKEWLENFADGKNKRGQMDIDQHLQKLKIRSWILEKLEGK